MPSTVRRASPERRRSAPSPALTRFAVATLCVVLLAAVLALHLSEMDWRGSSMLPAGEPQVLASAPHRRAAGEG